MILDIRIILETLEIHGSYILTPIRSIQVAIVL
jgi:hypothetical protein